MYGILIYLHFVEFDGINVGKYASHMDPMGYRGKLFCYYFTLWDSQLPGKHITVHIHRPENTLNPKWRYPMFRLMLTALLLLPRCCCADFYTKLGLLILKK